MLSKLLLIAVLIGLAVLGLVWLGVATLPAAPESIPPLPKVEVPIPPGGNAPQPEEADPAVAASRVLKGLVAALERGDGRAAASYFDPGGSDRVGEMAGRADQAGGCAALLTFWKDARLKGMKEIADDYRGTLMAGPGARRPYRIVLRLDERDLWRIRAIHPRPKR